MVEIRKSLRLKKAMFLKIFVRKWWNWKVVLIIQKIIYHRNNLESFWNILENLRNVKLQGEPNVFAQRPIFEIFCCEMVTSLLRTAPENCRRIFSLFVPIAQARHSVTQDSRVPFIHQHGSKIFKDLIIMSTQHRQIIQLYNWKLIFRILRKFCQITED